MNYRVLPLRMFISRRLEWDSNLAAPTSDGRIPGGILTLDMTPVTGSVPSDTQELMSAFRTCLMWRHSDMEPELKSVLAHGMQPLQAMA